MEKQYFFNPFVEPYLFYFFFFVANPTILYLWKVFYYPIENGLNMTLYLSIFIIGGLFMPRWISNIFNIVGGLITKRPIPMRMLPNWRRRLPFPFNRFEGIKVMIYAVGCLLFSLYYFNESFSGSVVSLLVFSLFLIGTSLVVMLSSYSDDGEEEISLEERERYVMEVIQNLNPKIQVSFFSSPFSVAYVRKKTVHVSKNALKLSLAALKRLLYHEYAHTLQRRMRYFIILLVYLSITFFTIFLVDNLFLIIPLGILLQYPFLFNLFSLMNPRFLPLWYLFTIVIPLFFLRWIIWNMELDAETWACKRLDKAEYLEGTQKLLESLQRWKNTHSRIPGFGLDRFYYIYPPIPYQITKALERCYGEKF